MIAFLTLFLGLIAGVHPVAVSVTGPVAAIEIDVDGAPAGRARSAPWTVSVDFGADLAPHELVARALDNEGHELSRTRQWINLPRSAAEVQILLERNEKGIATGARLSWVSVFSEAPTSLNVTFDGRPLVVRGNESFALPAYDPSTTHLLSASAEFPKGLRGRADAVIGGRTASEAASELTAVAVRLPERGGFADASPFEGAVLRAGAPVHPIALERGPAEVILIRSLSNAEAIQHLGKGGRALFDQNRRGTMPPFDPDALRLDMRLGDQDRLSFLWPISQTFTSPAGQSELFAGSRFFNGRDQGIHWLLTRVSHPGAPGPDPKFADAAAVAGLHALESCTRRAVILVLGRRTSDVSRYTPAMVRAYLEKIRVPLYVWTFDPSGKPGPWGAAEDISTTAKLRDAVDRLRHDLESQAVVWVEGKYLPQQVELSEALKGRGVSLAR
ncbi:MAG TPA: hypothetical protein VE007_13745 [Thermoanaerobaculia bacterium]|nr:hypothetical protein [Thermoanaerobaculia bacterium]